MSHVAMSFLLLLLPCCLSAADPDPGKRKPTLVEERQRLEALKRAQFQRLVAEFEAPATPGDNRKAIYYQIADLGLVESVDFLAQAYERDKAARRLYPAGGPDLVFMLWQIRRPESAAVLLRMMRDGHHDLRLLQAYAAVAGKDAVPELRRRGARSELIKLGDAEALAGVVKDLQFRDGDADNYSRVSTALSSALEAGHGARGATPAIIELLEELAAKRSTDWEPRQRDELALRAASTAAYLGDARAVPHLIRLPEAPEAGKPPSGGAITPDEFLARYTLQKFGTDAAAWRRWWEAEGRGAPLYTKWPQPDGGEIYAAALAWARAPESGPRIAGSPVYLLGWGDPSASTEDVRYYTPEEMRLLDVRYVQLHVLVSNGSRAIAALSSDPWHGPAEQLELLKSERGWRVVGPANEPEAHW